jgi:hypothetical protein
MAIRNDITFDMASSPRIITVDSPSTSVTIQDLLDTIRDFEDDLQNLSYPRLTDASGKESLGGGISVGITINLQNAKLAFEARLGPSFVQCEVSGGNLVAVDVNGSVIDPIETTDYTQVIRTSSTSATLVDPKALTLGQFLALK